MRNLSLKYRIALIIFVLEAIVIGLVLWNILSFSHEASQKQLASTELAVLGLLGDISRIALLTEEYSELQPYFEKIKRIDQTHIAKILLTDYQNRIVASGNPAEVGPIRSEEIMSHAEGWRIHEIENDAGKYGELAIQFSEKPLMEAYSAARTRGILTALGGMGIIAVVGIAVGIALTRRLDLLAKTANKIAKGDWNLKTNISGRDEVAQVGRAFDTMVDALRSSLNSLQQSEKRLGGILDVADEAVVTVDEAQIIQLFNKGAERIFVYRAEEIIGQPLSRLLPQAVHEVHRQHIAEFEKTPQTTRQMGDRTEVFGQRKDGTTFPAEASISKLRLENEIYFTAILRDVTDRKNAENRLEAAFSQLRHLTRRLGMAEEEERKRIARELHDEFGQVLTGLKFDLVRLDQQLRQDLHSRSDVAYHTQLLSMTKVVDVAIHTMRRIASDLRPSLLDDLGLVAALEWQVQEFQSRTSIPCTLTMSAGVKTLAIDSDCALATFRITQELLTNVFKHAHASNVAIALTHEVGVLTLQVTDDGRGITQHENVQTTSLGLLGIRERLVNLDGQFTIQGEPGKGTVVVVRIPMTPAPTGVAEGGRD